MDSTFTLVAQSCRAGIMPTLNLGLQYFGLMHEKMDLAFEGDDECNTWRLLYSPHKLTTKERTDLQAVISDVLFTCGTQIQGLNLSGRFHEVYTSNCMLGTN